MHGWPDSRADVPECVQAYFDVRDSLTIHGELIFKGQLLVVPTVMRKQLIEEIHSTHIGIEACVRRARDILYWPRMATELKEYIAKCDVCLAHRSGQGKEPLMQHELVARPWAKVCADLCDFDNRTLLVISDYYSSYIEVARLTTTTSRSVIKEMKAVFARFGVPDTLITDNGPQFSSVLFATLPPVKWEGRECRQDSEESVLQVQGSRKVRVPGTTRLVQHALCRNRYQPSPAPHGPAVQDASPCCRLSVTAAICN